MLPYAVLCCADGCGSWVALMPGMGHVGWEATTPTVQQRLTKRAFWTSTPLITTLDVSQGLLLLRCLYSSKLCDVILNVTA